MVGQEIVVKIVFAFVLYFYRDIKMSCYILTYHGAFIWYIYTGLKYFPLARCLGRRPCPACLAMMSATSGRPEKT